MKAHGPARAREHGIEEATVATRPQWYALGSVCALVLALSSSTPAEAGTVTLVPAAGPIGASAVVTGRGFPARARTLVRVGGVKRAALRADREGRFTASLTIPRTRRGVLKIASVSGAHRVVNVFRVRAAGQQSLGEVASESGARARWTPLEGRSYSALTVSLSHFPARRRVLARLVATRLTTARTNRRGRATLRLKVPHLPLGRRPGTVEARGQALGFDFVLTTEAKGPPAIAGKLVRPAIEDVTSATAYRYGARDDQGTSLDTLKVVPSPAGGYIGVYHALVGGVFVTKLARSKDLLRWKHVVDLAAHGSQPTIAALSDGGFLVAYEQDAGCTGTGPGGNCLAFRHYPTLAELLTGAADRSFQAARTLSNCAEGTPNIYAADLRPDIAHSVIDVGFHYFRSCEVDRQAHGTLRDFSSWSAHADAGLNGPLEAFRPGGNIGDRDYLPLPGGGLNIHEVQFTKGDFGCWRVYLYDWSARQASPLAIRTHRGSSAFANPTFTSLVSPAGRPALLVTLFIPSQGAAAGEGGELVYYRELTAGASAASP
jgi:hypothetical protein